MTGPGLLGGRYELRGILGFGGMAEVRDGWDTRLNRPVAIKLLHPGLSSQADIRERFQVEACAAAALNHPNIVRVYDFGDQEGTPFIVMERLTGDTLGDLIAFGPLPQARVFAALRSVIAALADAHDAGMLHRDIKPSNILLVASGGVKVADFGIVKAPGVPHTTAGQIMGTLAYLSPDRIAGKPASVADDLYAAGVVGYEALTGRKPFTQEDIAPLARAITEDQPPRLVDLRPDVDPGLSEVVERAMSRDPLRRFSSATAMGAALTGGVRHIMMRPTPATSNRRPPTRVLNARPGPASATFVVPPAARRRRVRTRGRKAAAAAAVFSAMAVTALAFALDPSSTTQPSSPKPVNVSTTVPPPVSGTAGPSPVVESPPPPTPVVEPAATQQQERDNGNGHDANNANNGNGGGNKKPKD